jgi:2-polyprenyl-3-methyl-5-hydroxy-6-metoxy-1,4-benzoquinol methylase
VDDIETLRQAYYAGEAGTGPDWTRYRHAHLRLPDWFVPDLDPWGEAYRAQQLRLWSEITGRPQPYRPEVDEEAAEWTVDPVLQPGYYVRRDKEAVRSAADHWLATGMILQHSGLQPGARALEYGAGFGQTALALARLGVHVDTVDISEKFCGFVRQQATFFQVPLQAFQGEFGFHPPPQQPYQLIWFYEAFHHCLDFERVVARLRGMLAPGGRVILAGEPIVLAASDALPYPWGIRLHSEVAVVMRHHGWMELGFSEPFLMSLFARAGFAGRRIDCEASPFGRLYVFEPSAQD